MNNNRFNNLTLMNIHRDILETVKPTKVLKAFIDKNSRKIELNIFNRFRVHLSSFLTKKKIIIKMPNKVDRLSLFLKIRSYILIQLCKLYF